MPDSVYDAAISADAGWPWPDRAADQGHDVEAHAVELLEALRDLLRPVRPARPQPAKPFIQDHGRFRTLQFDNLHLQSEMDLRDPIRLTIDYTRMMMGFLFFVGQPKRIEMIGLGGGSLAKYCHHTLPDAEIAIVEINRQVIDLRDQFLIPPDGPRFQVMHGDGADFVRRDAARPDIILVDGFDAYGQPPQLCSAEFYADCRRRLAPGGLMVVNLWGNHRDKCGYSARIRDAFSARMLEVATEGGSNRVVFAGRSETPMLSRTSVRATMAQIGPSHTPYLGSVGRRIVRCVEKRRRMGTAYAACAASGSTVEMAGEMLAPDIRAGGPTAGKAP